MKRKWTGVALLCAAALLLSACGGSKTSETTTENNSASEETQTDRTSDQDGKDGNTAGKCTGVR